MEFKVVAAASEKLAQIAADALIWVVTEDAIDKGLDPSLKALLDPVVAAGDLAWKAGRTVLLHHPQGLMAKRLVIAVATGTSAKPVKAAVNAALGQLKETLVFLDDPEAIESRGGYVPGGILLWGPPGTGKTLMAQAVAGETAKPFVNVDAGAVPEPASAALVLGGLGLLGAMARRRKQPA